MRWGYCQGVWCGVPFFLLLGVESSRPFDTLFGSLGWGPFGLALRLCSGWVIAGWGGVCAGLAPGFGSHMGDLDSFARAVEGP